MDESPGEPTAKNAQKNRGGCVNESKARLAAMKQLHRLRAESGKRSKAPEHADGEELLCVGAETGIGSGEDKADGSGTENIDNERAPRKRPGKPRGNDRTQPMAGDPSQSAS